MENIAVIQGTSECHTASDTNSFTNELYKIYNQEGMVIPILDIPRNVNKSWHDRGIKQICKIDIVEVGNNWTNVMWSASNIIEAKKEGIAMDSLENIREDIQEIEVPE